MASLAHHLVRRGLDATQEHFISPQGINPADEPQGQDDAELKRLAMWAITLIWVTSILFMALMSAVSSILMSVTLITARLIFVSRSPTLTATSLGPSP